MSRRSRAREVALQSLYQAEINAALDPRHRDRFHKGRLRSAPLIAFADAIVDGVRERQADLDALIDARSENWRVSRMAATDRAVLRIAAFELLHTDTPGPVGESSPTFVAGILGGILADRDGRPRPAAG